MTDKTLSSTGFDDYAEGYDEALAKGLSVSGEDKEYFARGRVLWLSECLRQLSTKPQSVMDFGCGTGSASQLFLNVIGAEFVLGIDSSQKLLDIARQTCGSERSAFVSIDEYRPSGTADLVFCNGVFHHIPLRSRAAVVGYIYRSLRPGGIFALWENNPWNPGTRYVMRRIPFDHDAITLTHAETRRLLLDGGFEVLRTDFMFIFPKVLRWFRWMEPHFSRLPIGAQYQVLARKPASKWTAL